MAQKNILSKKSDLDPSEEKDGSESNNLPVNEDKSKTPTKSSEEEQKGQKRSTKREGWKKWWLRTGHKAAASLYSQ